MDIEVYATVEISNVIDEINKYKWKYRLLPLCEILNNIEWATDREGKEMSWEEKEMFHKWIKRKLEWIEGIKTPNKSFNRNADKTPASG